MKLVLLGIILIILGFLILLVGLIKHTKFEFAIGGFIGPLPFGIASSNRMLFILIAVLIILAILQILLVLK